MIRTFRQRVAAFALTLLVATATPAFAGPLPDPEKMRDRAEHMMQAVDASPQQRQQTWNILDAALEHMRAFREEGLALRERLWQSFMTGDKVDRGQIHSIRARLVDLFDRATGRGFDVMADLADVYTPAQRQQMREMRKSRDAKGGHGGESRGGAGRGDEGRGGEGRGDEGRSGEGRGDEGRQRDRRGDTVTR